MPKYMIYGGALIRYSKIVKSGQRKDETGYVITTFTPTECELVYNSTGGGNNFGVGIQYIVKYPDFIGKTTKYLIHLSAHRQPYSQSVYMKKLKLYAFVIQFDSKRAIRKISFRAKNDSRAKLKFDKILENRRKRGIL